MDRPDESAGGPPFDDRAKSRRPFDRGRVVDDRCRVEQELGEDAPEPDERDEKIKALESEVRDLKAKAEQLIAEKAEIEDKLTKATAKPPRRPVEVVKTREVEVVGQHVDVIELTKRALDIRRGLV